MADLTITKSEPLPLSIVKTEAATPDPPNEKTSQVGETFWEQIGGKTLMDLMAGASRTKEGAERTKAAFTGLVEGIKNEPARVWSELSEAGKSMLNLDLPGTAYHLGGSAPFLGAPAQQVATEVDQGKYGQAVERTAALILPFAAPKIAGAVKSGVKAAASAAASPAARDVIGVVSPRAKHAMDLAARVKKAADAFRGEAETPVATPASASQPVGPRQPVESPQSVHGPSPAHEAQVTVADALRSEIEGKATASRPGPLRSPMAEASPTAPPPAQYTLLDLIELGRREAGINARSPIRPPLARPEVAVPPAQPPAPPASAPAAPPAPAEVPRVAAAPGGPVSLAEALRDEMLASGTLELPKPAPVDVAPHKAAQVMRSLPTEARRAVADANYREVKGGGDSPITVYRSSQKANQPIMLNDQGMLYTSADKAYTQNWGAHTQEIQIRPRKTLDLTRIPADAEVSAADFAGRIEKAGVEITPELQKRLNSADGGEVLQYFGQYGQKELASALRKAGYDSVKINEYHADSGTRAVSHIVLDERVLGARSEAVKPRPLYEAAARQNKAEALAKALHEGGITSADAKLMEQPHWDSVSRAIGGNPASKRTQATVVFELRKLELKKRGAKNPAQAATVEQDLADAMKASGTVR